MNSPWRPPMWSKLIRFLAHFSQVRGAKNTTTHNWNFETSALLSLVQLKLNNIAVILSVHQLPPSLSVLVNVISSCDWVLSSFSALPDTLLVIWFVKIISVNMEHFGALAVLALRETKDPNCCANQNVFTGIQKSKQPFFCSIHLRWHGSAKCAKMQLSSLKE